MEAWLRMRLAEAAVSSKTIFEEARSKWTELKDDTRERKLRRALRTIGGDSEDGKPRTLAASACVRRFSITRSITLTRSSSS
jgi:hypothetical protein